MYVESLFVQGEDIPSVPHLLFSFPLYFEHRGSIAAVSCHHHTIDARKCLRHFFRCLLRSWLTFFFLILVAVFFAAAFFF